MYEILYHRHTKLYRKIFSAILAFVFTLSLVVGPTSMAQAQFISSLPKPGQMVLQSPSFNAPALMGMTLHPENPLAFDFIVHRGQDKLSGEALKGETSKLLKYFLAAMTMPEKDSWVNLSPYENDRIIPDQLAVTDLGKDMLEQDYLLKQLSASLTSPETDLGKKFWQRVYQKAYEKYGTSQIPINTFNKVWITPDSATIIEQDGYVFIGDSHLKVMLDQDYASIKENLSNEKMGTKQISADKVADISEVSSQVVKEIIIPELEKEVNSGKNFAPVRQMYHSVILASWYKQNLKNSLLGKIYVDQKKIGGVDTAQKDIKQRVYEQYLEAFRKGVYSLIKEDFDMASKETMPRKYFSGGLEWTDIKTQRADGASAAVIEEQYKKGVNAGDFSQVAMVATEGIREIAAVSQTPAVASSPVQEMRDQGQVATYTIDTNNANKNQVYLAVGNVLIEVVPYRENFTVQVIGLLDENMQLQLLTAAQRPAPQTFDLDKAIMIGRRSGEVGIYTPPLSDGSLSRRHLVLEVSAVSGKENLKNIKITNLSTSNGTGRTQTLEDFRIKPRQRNIQEDTITAIIRTLQEAVIGADAVGRYVTPGLINPDAVEATFELTVDRVTGLSKLGGLQIQEGITIRFDVLAQRTIKLSSQGTIPANIVRAVEIYNREIVHTTTINAIPVQTNFDANNPYTAKLNGRELLAFVVSDPSSQFSLTDLDMTVFRDPLTNTVMVNYQPTLLGDIAKESKTLTIGQSFGVDMGDGRMLFVSNKSNSSISIGVVGQGQLTIIPKISSSAIIGLAELTKLKPQILAEVASRVPEFAWTFRDDEKNLLLGNVMSPEKRDLIINGIRNDDRKRVIASRFLRGLIPFFSADGWHADLKDLIKTLYGQAIIQDPLSDTSRRELRGYLNTFWGAHTEAYKNISQFVLTKINPDLPSLKAINGNLTPEVLTDLLLGDLRFFLTPEIFFKEIDLRLNPAKPVYEPQSTEETISTYRYFAESLRSISESTRNDLLNSVRDSELLSDSERSAVVSANDEKTLKAVLDNGRKSKVLAGFLVELLVYAKPEEWEAVLRVVWSQQRGQTPAQFIDTFLNANGTRFLAQAGVGIVLRNPELVRLVAEETGLTGNALIRQAILQHPNFPDFMTPVKVASSANQTVKSDQSTENVGGIDFDPSLLNLQIKRNGQGVPLPLPQQNLEQINIDGLYPVILNIQPATIQNIPFLLSHKTGDQIPALSMR